MNYNIGNINQFNRNIRQPFNKGTAKKSDTFKLNIWKTC